ncbi:MAG: hypothetical protein EBY83_09000, partial [Verrucomicrobia bacterium]|nr:hypothetical protein [Verrucomicrobiota bacterium]
MQIYAKIQNAAKTLPFIMCIPLMPIMGMVFNIMYVVIRQLGVMQMLQVVIKYVLMLIIYLLEAIVVYLGLHHIKMVIIIYVMI